MIQLKEIKTNHEHYPFMEQLLETAFPLQERRDSDKQRKNTDENPLFHNTLITDDDIVIYTGYNYDEIKEQINTLKYYKNIIIKFGRFIPNQPHHYDKILGIELSSPNQYAERIS